MTHRPKDWLFQQEGHAKHGLGWLGLAWGGWCWLGKHACNLKLAQGVKDSQLGCHASKESLAKAELQKFDQLHGAWSQGLIHLFFSWLFLGTGHPLIHGT